MFTMNKHNLHVYCLGATMLGSGGGGHPKILYDLVAYLMDLHGDVNIISLEELKDDDLVVPVAFVGAPLINLERVPNTKIFDAIYEKIKLDFPNKNIVLMPAEIGGCNALTPLILALKYKLPVLDADLIGRAFPRIDMCKPAVLNQSCNPTYLADHMGNFMSLHLTRLSLLENIVRDVTVHFGSSEAIATFLFEGKRAHQYVIEQSISRALKLGIMSLETENFLESTRAVLIGSGTISDVYHDMHGGFLFGYTVVKNEHSTFKIHYQNEFLSVSENGIDIYGSPNILVVIEKRTCVPLTTESLAYGLEVNILSLPAPDFWLHPSTFALVDYKSFTRESA